VLLHNEKKTTALHLDSKKKLHVKPTIVKNMPGLTRGGRSRPKIKGKKEKTVDQSVRAEKCKKMDNLEKKKTPLSSRKTLNLGEKKKRAPRRLEHFDISLEKGIERSQRIPS